MSGCELGLIWLGIGMSGAECVGKVNLWKRALPHELVQLAKLDWLFFFKLFH
jgi:hypothetical protein